MIVKIKMDKNYNRKEIETKWYKRWQDAHCFRAGQEKNKDKVPYVIMMPPPNVTGALHNGHALFITLQDILCRFYRMKGRDVLWLPGTDHAGIATQTIVEKEIKLKEGLTKYDLGREQFLNRVFAWKEKHGQRIIEQLKLMGASADWSRLRFTMDEQCSKAVRTAFVKLWNDGLIYRKERLISWDPVAKTALSSEEVDHVERKGELFHFAYKFKENSNKEIIVATTRPETMLGDVAVAVHPDDSRYENAIGKELIHPFIKDRVLKVVADDAVQMDFGSGAVKITPAHDQNDFEIAERHNLPLISIFTFDASINDKGDMFKGLNRYDARKKVKEKLKNLGLFRKSEEINHFVSISQRSCADIEPMLSRQYFVNTKPLAKKAYEAVESGDINIIPPMFKKTWDHFLLNIREWCISRQLWWGHRIPVYYHIDTLKKAIYEFGKQNPNADCYQSLKRNEPLRKIISTALNELDEDTIRNFSHAYVDPPCEHEDYIQEEDVLDTWFSSGLWPFATLGWPKNTPDLNRYYPTSVLETGFDIIFFWVARMVMLGIYFMGKPPFKDIYLHSMVRDAHGRKMSKSLGNAIDPIDVVEGISLEDLIKKTKNYPVSKSQLPKVIEGIKKDFKDGIPSAGADGLRLSLAIFSGQGRDVKFSIPRVMGYRAFLNKVWNATRFTLMHIQEDNVFSLTDCEKDLSLADKFILSKLQKTIKKINQSIHQYNFSDAADLLYHFFWDEYCDKYIEYSKTIFDVGNDKQIKTVSSVLIYLLDNSMRLLHPFCPFISEEIWQVLPSKEAYRSNTDFCAIAPFPKENPKYIDDAAENALAIVFDVCAMIRNSRQQSGLKANKPIPAMLFAKNKYVRDLLVNQKDLISHLAKTSKIEIYIRGEKSVEELCITNSNAVVDSVILLEGLIDINKEISRLDDKLKKIDKEKGALSNRLQNKRFIDNAPVQVVENAKNELAELIEKEKQISLAKTRLKKAKSRKNED